MVRYLEVIVGEASRMRIARMSRGYDPRWLWQARAVAASAGTLFVRSFERGERVHLAMVSRGYAGTMPQLHEHVVPPRAWVVAGMLPAVAAAVLAVALLGP
jgi:cobalt/nickel transport system permease protein